MTEAEFLATGYQGLETGIVANTRLSLLHAAPKPHVVANHMDCPVKPDNNGVFGGEIDPIPRSSSGLTGGSMARARTTPDQVGGEALAGLPLPHI